MNLLVCVTDVLHFHDLVLPESAAQWPRGCRMPNRAEECAVEMAIRLRERQGGRVTLLSVAPPETEETLDSYAGMGADAVVRLWEERLRDADAGIIAQCLARAARRLDAGLVLCGERAFGGDGTGLTGPLLAENLGWPFLGGVIAVESRTRQEMEAQRLIERGDRQMLRVSLPGVIAVSPEGPAPRYPALAKARRAARETWALDTLDASLADALPVSVTGWAMAKPQPKKLFAPPSTASAADRLKMVMGGGKAKKAQDSFVEAPAEQAAEQILQFLRQEKLIAR